MKEANHTALPDRRRLLQWVGIGTGAILSWPVFGILSKRSAIEARGMQGDTA